MSEEVVFVVYGGIVLFLILSVAIVFFVIAYKKSQRAHITEKQLLQQAFQTELLSSQLEISEQTMKQIAQEIHDNIGQRMTLAIQLNQQGGASTELQPILQEVLNDLRNLSHSLHTTKIADMGLDLALERECELMAKATQLTCNYQPPKSRILLTEQNEIILFRCAQEILNNVIKHARAKKIAVRLETSGQFLNLQVKDDGNGFDYLNIEKGLGLTSLKNRVEMINGTLDIQSTRNTGTMVSISVPLNQ
jgi:signal transduction histidine kinase